MKLIRYFIVAALCILTIVSATACKKPEAVKNEVTKYGVVYNHYVCAVTVVLENERIESVKFEEAEAPYSWARISNITTEINEIDKYSNSVYSGTGTNHVYAKKIKIGDTVFSARDNGETNNYIDYYNADKNGSTPFEIWLAVSVNAKWYFENISTGNYDVLKDDSTAYNVTFKSASTGELTKSDRWLKSKNGYWSASETQKGWSGNIYAMENYIKTHGFNDYEAARDTISAGEEEIEINGIKTGATIAYFKDYMNLALEANNDALAKYNETRSKATQLFLY